MRILVDTNVILDILLNRSPFVENSFLALEKSIKKGDKLYFSSSSVTDVYYIIRKQTKSVEIANEALLKLAKIFNFALVDEECIFNSFKSLITDYEDALIDEVACKAKAEIILSRNTEDFTKSKTIVMTPTAFLEIE